MDRWFGRFYRPPFEWLFLLAMVALGVNSLIGIGPASADGWERSVRTGNVVMGLSALGVVVAILAARAWGLPLLWLLSAAALYTGSIASWKLGGAPMIAVLGGAMLIAFVFALVIWYGTRRVHARVTERRWPALVADHAVAAREYVAAISALSPAAWVSRSTPEAWSPADITEHLSRTYGQFAGESRGKNPLRVRVPPVRRLAIRLLVKPRLLAGRTFPKARAPRELRPTGSPPTVADGVVMFRTAGDSCMRDLETLLLRRPFRTLTHPYFGRIPLYEMLQFAAQHIRHHRRQLPS